MNASYDVQYFNTTNYPDNYPNDQDCQWEINAPGGHFIVLTFKDFLVEDIFDYVEVLDLISSKVIAKLSSKKGLNATYRSSGPGMLVKFHSDGSRSFKGFEASFKEGEILLYLLC